MNPLQASLARLRHRIRRLVVLQGLGRVAAVIPAAVCAVCLFDWLVHVDSPAARLCMALALAAGTVWLVVRHILRPLREPLSDVQLALQVERLCPEWRDRLASGVEFLATPRDPLVGSPALQQLIVDRTMGRIATLDAAAVLDTQLVKRSLFAAAVVAALVTLAVVSDQSRAATALTRLVFPYAAGEWPRETALQFLSEDFVPLTIGGDQPLRCPEGETLTLYVENRYGRLPKAVVLQRALRDGSLESQPLRHTTLRDQGGHTHDVAVAALTAERGALRFRAVGGDDDRMGWLTLEVVPPAVVNDFTLTLTPPAYSAQPPSVINTGVGHVHGLLGTRVRVEARANTALRSVVFRRDGNTPALALPLGDDARSFTTEFAISEPGRHSYWFELTDEHGLRNSAPPRYEIRGIADREPLVVLEWPDTDLTVTPQAEIPLRLSASDDLGLTSLRLVFTDGEAAEQERDLGEPGIVLGLEARRETSFPLELLQLSQGRQVTFRIQATDAFDLGATHIGRSSPRTLTVVSPPEKLAELASRQSAIADALQRAADLQAHLLQQTSELRIQWQAAQGLRPEDVDLLKRLEQDQRRISGDLHGPRVGVMRQARGILDELAWNRLQDDAMRERLQYIVKELEGLRLGPLADVETVLTRLRKTVSAGGAAPPVSTDDQSQVAAALEQTAGAQSTILTSLQGMLELLSAWRRSHDALQRLGDLLAGQQQLATETADLGSRTITRPWNELSAQDRADLGRIAERQSRLGIDLQQWQQELIRSAEQLEATDPSAAVLRDAAGLIDRLGIRGNMQAAAEDLGRNNVGRAATAQQQAVQSLQSLESVLRDAESVDAETLAKEIDRADEELETLQKRQSELRYRAQGLSSPSEDPARLDQLRQLREEQQALAGQLDDMARRLRHRQLTPAANSSSRAAQRMHQAAEGLDSGNVAPTLSEQQQALDDIEQARRELAQAREQVRLQQAVAQLAELGTLVESLAARQQSVIDEARRLESERQQRGSWSRAQLKSVNTLSESQAQLAGDVDNLAAKLTTAEAIRTGLQLAAGDMQRAATRLAARNTDAATIHRAELAYARLDQVREALRSLHEPEGGTTPGTAESAAPPPAADSLSIALVAQIRLLRQLQEDVSQRTTALAAQLNDAPTLNDEQRAEQQALAAAQGQIAEAAAALAKSLQDSPANAERPRETN